MTTNGVMTLKRLETLTLKKQQQLRRNKEEENTETKPDINSVVLERM